MTPEQFAAALRGDQKPAAVKVCNFAGRVAGRLPVKPSQMRAVRHFLEAEDAPAPAWISKRNAADKKSPRITSRPASARRWKRFLTMTTSIGARSWRS